MSICFVCLDRAFFFSDSEVVWRVFFFFFFVPHPGHHHPHLSQCLLHSLPRGFQTLFRAGPVFSQVPSSPLRLFSLRKVCPGSWISNMISSEKIFDMDLGGGLEKVWHRACETVYEPYSVPLLQWCSVPVEMVQSPLEML